MSDVGFRKWLGLNYEVMEDGHAEVSIDLTEDMYNLREVAHGGVVASLIDVTMGTAASGGNYATRKRPMVTLEMKVNYVAGAKGKALRAVADVVRAGSRTAVVRCEVKTDRGEVCAVGLGTFISRRVHQNERPYDTVEGDAPE